MISRIETTPEEYFTTTLFNNIIEGKTVYLPRELISVIEQSSPQARGRDNTALVYYLVQSECERTNEETVGVHSGRFDGISKDSESIKRARGFLQEKGFLEVGGSYQVGVSSKEHTLRNDTDLVEYHLEAKSSHAALYRETQEDDRCKQTRENLDRVVVDIEHARKIFRMTAFKYLLFGLPELRDKEPTSGEKKHIKNGINIENLPKRTVANLHGLLIPLNQIIHNKGRVFRDRKGRRLFSPLTQLKKHFRDCLSIDGEKLVSLDSICCQPSLIACLAGDTGCLDDCVNDRFYSNIAEKLSVTRDQAKETFCQFSFGPRRTANTSAKMAFAVQNIIKERYPGFAQYVWDAKKGDYREFSHKLQEFESHYFIDGVLAELQQKGIFSLTIHDSILVKKSDVQQAKNVLQEKGKSIIGQYLRSTQINFQFKTSEKENWFPGMEIITKPLLNALSNR